MTLGLRCVGKTVLLDQMRIDAEKGVFTLFTSGLLAPQLRLAFLRLSRIESAKKNAIRGLRALAGFAGKLKLKYGDIEVGLDYEPEPGLADNGEMEGDLAALLEEVGKTAKEAKAVLVIFIDELQYVEEDQLAALISGLHRCSQEKLPVTVVGAGLPQLRGRLGKAKSYAERLFEFPIIGRLSASDAKEAIMKPAEKVGVHIADDAVNDIIAKTQGYPYFLQEMGKHIWDIALKSPITFQDANNVSTEVIAARDESFFRVRFDRLTAMEKKYLRAMADLGPGPHRSGDIAEKLGRVVQSMGPIRNNLILKGMIWSPTHGDTAFTVPLFDEIMKRIMPGKHWKTSAG